jgi:hypothetical protein
MGKALVKSMIPDAQRAWDLFVTRHVELFVRALTRLIAHDCSTHPPRQCEDDISKLLSALLREICYEMKKECEIDIRVPTWEGPIPPRSTKDVQGEEVGKRPDFTCIFPNPRPGSHENIEIPFHVECKIIGKDKGSQKTYKENYVRKGIVRFDSKSHGYGCGSHCGMMIGYQIGESSGGILCVINQIIAKEVSGHRPLSMTFNSQKVGKSESQFDRQHVAPQSFTLFHLWADLKDFVFQT